MMKPPLKPSKEDCCNSGCSPCIFDIYDKQLALYNKYLQTGEVAVVPEKNAISQTEYTIFIVTENVHLCESHRLLKFRRRVDLNEKVFWQPGDHFLVKFTSETSTCTRAYTPIKLKNQSQENFDFLVIVKKYDDGLVSNYLFNLKPDFETLWRGPYGCYDITPNKYKRLFMIAQGTGIAPFISIIEAILNNEEDFTKLFLYYCCQSLDSVMFREHLYLWKSFWNFTYTVFIKEPNGSNSVKYEEPIRNDRLRFSEFDCVKPFHTDDQFLVCGSTNFMKSYKEWLINEEKFQGNIVLF